MKLLIDVDEKLVCEGFVRNFTEEERDILIRAIGNSTSLSTELKQIKEEIKRTYYSQGVGFDDFPQGFICAKDEDMEIIDKYIRKADM